MDHRHERLGGDIRAAVADMLVRGEIKDARVRQAGLITVTRVDVTGDLRRAKVHFAGHDLEDQALDRVSQGLSSAAGFVARHVARELKLRFVPELLFVVDRGFDNLERVTRLLKDA